MDSFKPSNLTINIDYYFTFHARSSETKRKSSKKKEKKEKVKKIFYITILLFLTSCATGSWQSRSGSNSNLNIDTGYCKSLANAKYPIYICRMFTYCAPDETNKAISSLTQNAAAFDNCMYTRGYYYRQD